MQQCRLPRPKWRPAPWPPEKYWILIHVVKDPAKRRELAISRFQQESDGDHENPVPPPPSARH